MSFIEDTYFTGEIKLWEIGTGKVNNSNLTQAIAQYEPEILKMLLGYKLYSLLIADLNGSGIPQTQKYIDLVNGKEFTHEIDGQTLTLKWEGLKNSAKLSLIAYYVYYKYVERDITRAYGSGVSMAKPSEGWDRASAVNKLCSTWERMRDLYGKIPPELKSYYKVPTPVAEISGPFDYEPSAFNFLYANQSDYPDWIFTPLWNLNAFGI